MKFSTTDTDYAETIRKVKTAKDSAFLGRDKSKPKKTDWDDVRVDYMKKALYAKFTQHKDLKEVLLGTKDALLVEHTKNDNTWGDGGDGTGLNLLGKCLMEIREIIRKENENE